MPITTTPTKFYGHRFITRKTMTAFMDWLATHIYVERYDENGSIYRYIQVPVQYAGRERFVNVLKAQNQYFEYGPNTTLKLDLNRILPRMAVSIIAMTYDAERHLSKYQKVRASAYGSDGSIQTIPAPAPYSLEVELTAISKTVDDNYQIVEQLLPYFTPTLNLNLNMLDGFDPKSVGFTLNSVQPEGAEDLSVDEERLITTTFTFTVKLDYPYTKLDRGTINEILMNLHVGKGESEVDLENDDFVKFQQYQLTADNMTPVTEISNREEEPVTISQTDNPVESIAISVESGKGTISLLDSDPTSQYTAVATYVDGSTIDVTETVVWDSSDETIGTIDSGSGTGGLLTAVSAGTTIITCTLKGVVSDQLTQTVTV